jgi:hypothetical protein
MQPCPLLGQLSRVRTPPTCLRARAQFSVADENHDGVVTGAEMRHWLHAALSLGVVPDAVFLSISGGGDGSASPSDDRDGGLPLACPDANAVAGKHVEDIAARLLKCGAPLMRLPECVCACVCLRAREPGLGPRSAAAGGGLGQSVGLLCV